MIPGRPRCSAESVGRDEELFATASLVNTWILFEQPGAWGARRPHRERVP